jgi:hypothetical protein
MGSKRIYHAAIKTNDAFSRAFRWDENLCDTNLCVGVDEYTWTLPELAVFDWPMAESSDGSWKRTHPVIVAVNDILDQCSREVT